MEKKKKKERNRRGKRGEQHTIGPLLFVRAVNISRRPPRRLTKKSVRYYDSHNEKKKREGASIYFVRRLFDHV